MGYFETPEYMCRIDASPMLIKTLRPLMKDSGEVAVASVLQQVVSAAAFIFLARQLGLVGFGEYSVAVAAVASIYAFAGNWVTPYMVAAGARQFASGGKLGDIFLGCSAISLACCLLAFPILVFILPRGRHYVIMSLPLLVSAATLPLMRCGFQIAGDFKSFGRLLWLDRGLFFVGVLLVGYAWKLNPIGAVIVATVSQVLAALAGAAGLVPSVEWSVRNFSTRQFATESLPTFFAAAFTYFSSGAFVVIAASRLYDQQVSGAAAAAFVLIGFAGQPVQWLAPVLLTRFARHDAPDIVRSHISRMTVSVVMAYVGFVAAASVSMPFVTDLLGGGFPRHEGMFVSLMATIPAEALHVLVVPVLFARGYTRSIMIAAALKAAIVLCALAFCEYPQQFARFPSLAAWLGSIIELWMLRASIPFRDWVYIIIAAGLSLTAMYGHMVSAVCAVIALILVVWRTTRSVDAADSRVWE